MKSIIFSNPSVTIIFLSVISTVIIGYSASKISSLNKEVELKDSLFIQSLKLNDSTLVYRNMLKDYLNQNSNKKVHYDTVYISGKEVIRVLHETDTIHIYHKVSEEEIKNMRDYLTQRIRSDFEDSLNLYRDKLILSENLFCELTGYESFVPTINSNGRIEPYTTINFKSTDPDQISNYKTYFDEFKSDVAKATSAEIMFGALSRKFSKDGGLDQDLLAKITRWNNRIQAKKEREKEKRLTKPWRSPN